MGVRSEPELGSVLGSNGTEATAKVTPISGVNRGGLSPDNSTSRVPFLPSLLPSLLLPTRLAPHRLLSFPTSLPSNSFPFLQESTTASDFQISHLFFPFQLPPPPPRYLGHEATLLLPLNFLPSSSYYPPRTPTGLTHNKHSTVCLRHLPVRATHPSPNLLVSRLQDVCRRQHYREPGCGHPQRHQHQRHRSRRHSGH